MNQKTTDEIQKLLSSAELDFESIVNKALNNYLPKIFRSCPFTEEICTTKQCIECAVSKNVNKLTSTAKKQKSKQSFTQETFTHM